MEDQSLTKGSKLESYEIVDLLGLGGFGITYKGHDKDLQRVAVIKEYFPRQFAHRLADQSVVPLPGEENAATFKWGLDRFLSEARTLAKLSHRNVVEVSRYLEVNGTAYFVMKYENGIDLDAWLKRQSNEVPEHEIRRILDAILDGLQAVHDHGLIHRDLKPANILMRDGNEPVLIDFGSARPVARTENTELTALISQGYSPAEQYGNTGEAQGPWTDIYSVSAILLRLVDNVHPDDVIKRMRDPDRRQISPIRKGISDSLAEAIRLGMEIEPKDRPQSVIEFRRLLDPEIGTGTVRRDADYRAKPGNQTHKSARIYRTGGIASICALLIATVYVSGYLDWPISIGSSVKTDHGVNGVVKPIKADLAFANETEQLKGPVEHITESSKQEDALDRADRNADVENWKGSYLGNKASETAFENVELKAQEIVSPNKIKPGTSYRTELDKNGRTYYKIDLPQGQYKMILDTRQLNGSSKSILGSKAALLDQFGEPITESAIYVHTIGVWRRATFDFENGQSRELMVKIENNGAPAMHWLTVVDRSTGALPPFLGNILPTMFTVGESASGELPKNTADLYITEATKGDYRIIVDFENAQGDNTAIIGYVAVLQEDGGEEKQIFGFLDLNVASRKVQKITLSQDTNLILKVANNSDKVRYRLFVDKATEAN